MKISGDKDRPYKIERIAKKNTLIAIKYFSIYFILLMAIYYFKHFSVVIFSSILITILYAYVDYNFGNVKKHKILNYFPFWFLASLITFVLLLFSDIGISNLLNHKMIIVLSFIIHGILWVTAIGTAENIYEEKRKSVK